MERWAEEELRYVDLGDKRRKKRLIKIVENLALQPGASIPQASKNMASTTATYDFFSSPYFQPSQIIEAQAKSARDRMKKGEIVLAIQDTTNLDFTTQKAKKGMGYLDAKTSLGLKVHTTLSVSSQGVPLGIINQQVWSRDPKNLGKAKKRRTVETKEKESQKWLNSLSQTQSLIPEEIEVITIADAEADIFDLFCEDRNPNSHLLVRGTHNRKVEHPLKYLHQAIREVKSSGELNVEVKRSPSHDARTAKLTIKFTTLTIQVPRHHINKAKRKQIKLQVILAEEEHPIPGVSPISWLLLTTVKVESLAQAINCVNWYSYRWLIERYHYVLKSGCKLEQLQLETASRIKMALATYSIVAWRLLWLTYEARLNPEKSCDIFLEKHQWQSLCATINLNHTVPEEPPSIKEAVRMIASLGGFLGRKGDGFPGVKTIWLGLRRLFDISETWKMLHQNSWLPPPTLLSIEREDIEGG